jgi:GH24 family phage-related lysozyme (muramidase)
MAASLSQVKLSNVIGAPFDKFVLEQLYLRAIKNSATSRNIDDVLFLANKSAWVRLVSSVNIVIPEATFAEAVVKGDNPLLSNYVSDLGLDSTVYPNSNSLAKEWVLEAGTSKYNGQSVNLRSGIGPDGAYGLGSTEELGYRPMPGLSSVSIETAGRLGSLRFANINFKVWNLTQLNVIEALYFRLGYSMLLEWGHTQFYLNPSLQSTNFLQTATNTYGIDDPFVDNLTISTLQQKIYDKKYQMSGNYDGMVGVVSSFNWSLNQEGGYDCSVKLIGKGSIIESLRINQSYKIPKGKLTAIAEQFNQEREAQKKRELEIKEANRVAQIEATGKPAVVPKNLNELWRFSTKFDNKQSEYGQFLADNDYWWYTAYNLDGINGVPDWFYKSPNTDYNKTWVGLFLQRGDTVKPWKVLHDDPSNSRFSLDNPLVEKFTDKYLAAYFNSGNLPEARTSIAAIKDVQNTLAKLFQWSATSVNNQLPNFIYKRSSKDYYGPNDPLDAGVTITAELDNIKVQYGSEPLERRFYITVKYQGVQDPSQNIGFIPTRTQVCVALDEWLSSGGATVLESIDTTGIFQKELVIKGWGIAPISTEVVNVNDKTQHRPLNAVFELTFNNTSFIYDVLPSLNAPLETAPQESGTENSGNTEGATNNPTNVQVNPPAPLESALHFILNVIKNATQVNGANVKKDVIKVPLLGSNTSGAGELTPAFFEAGIFGEVLNTKQTTGNINGVPYDLVKYAQKGFNSYLMTNPLLYDTTPFVNFEELSTAYLVKYLFSNEDQTPGPTDYPVYIKFGYLLALLNSLCLIYDSNKPQGEESSKGAKKEPYVFIDFNPDTNFCLTSPQHLSIDPKVCLIPFNGTEPDYQKIFPKDIGVENPFNPAADQLSNVIQSFKTNNPYQGRTMNILLNVDYLLTKADSFASSDAEHGVYLQSYLDAIVTDVNVSLGNQNKFRVAYRDDSNTVQILDDQFTPPGVVTKTANIEEPYILDRNVYINTPAEVPNDGFTLFGSPRYGQLPIFGLQSLVRNMQFKTNLSSKLASLIAISAQSTTASINSTDPTSLTYLNQNFQDRYKPFINNASTVPANENNAGNALTSSNNDAIVADEFNSQVLSIYSFVGSVDTRRTDTAKNYYIERVSNTKAGDPVTAAAPFIPADLEITLDGVSGIVMGNAFTIPENRLPNSLKGKDGFTKVGFIVAGLTHTIDNNEWLTKIKGQMIKLRENTKYGESAAYNTKQRTIQKPSTTSALTGNVLDDAINLLKSLEGLYSSKPGVLQLVSNATSDTVIYAYPDSGGVATIGWGTILYGTGVKAGSKVTLQDTTTLAQAEAELRLEASKIYSYILANLKPVTPLTDGQIVALISLGYNTGLTGLSSSPIWKSLESGAGKELIANQFLDYRITVKKGTVIVQGLINRRKQESQIFLS